MQNWQNVSHFPLNMTHFYPSFCLNCLFSSFFRLYTWLKCFQIQNFFGKGVFFLNNLSATKYDFWQGGGGGVSQYLTFLTSSKQHAKFAKYFLFFSKNYTILSHLFFLCLFQTLNLSKMLPDSKFLPERCILFN